MFFPAAHKSLEQTDFKLTAGNCIAETETINSPTLKRFFIEGAFCTTPQFSFFTVSKVCRRIGRNFNATGLSNRLLIGN